MPAAPAWTTASFGHASHTTPGDLLALGDHLALCRTQTGRWFALQSGGEAMHRFLAPRLVTLMAALLLIGGVTLAL